MIPIRPFKLLWLSQTIATGEEKPENSEPSLLHGGETPDFESRLAPQKEKARQSGPSRGY
jgi:hypothetical protein